MKKLLFLSLLYFYTNVYANNNQVYKNKLNRCTITKSLSNDYEPMVFESTNNLLRKTGQLPKYYGEKILIKGRVVDQNCVPVADAKVYAWQVGADGKYPYEPLRNRINKNLINLKSTSTFTGCGTATTNNNGEYYFVTLKPKVLSKEGAYVNIRIEHRSLKEVQTKIYLSEKNICAGECAEMLPVVSDVQESMRSYCMDIVLSGTTLKRY